MTSFLIRRIFAAVFVLLCLTAIIFLLVYVAGDPISIMMAGTGMSQEELSAFKEELGLDKPLYFQYLDFLKGLFKGELGDSIFFGSPAAPIIMSRLPATAKLAAVSFTIALIVSVPIGIVSALKVNTFVDYFARSLALVGQAVPYFWLAIMGIMFFAVKLQILPSSGIGSFRHYVLPSITLATFPIARLVRITRSAMLDVIHQDYITTARAKGVRESLIFFKHAFKNASISVITMSGLLIGELLGGSVIIETVFAWPGTGRLAVQAVNARDFPLLQGIVFVIALAYLTANLVVDIIYGFLDPRIVYD